MRNPVNDIGDQAWGLAARLLGLVMVWFGAMRLMPFGIDALARDLDGFPGGGRHRRCRGWPMPPARSGS